LKNLPADHVLARRAIGNGYTTTTLVYAPMGDAMLRLLLASCFIQRCSDADSCVYSSAVARGSLGLRA
jgi:hypothetical protein